MDSFQLDTDNKLAKPATEKKTRFPGGRFGLSVFGFAAVNAALVAAVVASSGTMPGASIVEDVLSNNLKQSPSYGTWSWWAARAYFSEKKAPDVVMMGSSLVNSACWSADATTTYKDIDCALHHRVFTLEKHLKERLPGKDPTVLNISIQGAGACDYYMMTRGLMEGARKPKVLVVGIAPRDFIDNKIHNLGDTEPFMFHQRYVDFDETVARAYSNPFVRAMGELEWKIGRLPLRRLHAAVASYFTDGSGAENTRRKEAGDDLRYALSASSQRIFPGDIVVPKVVPEGFHDNTAEYVSRYKNPHPQHFTTQLFFFEEMLKRMNAQNIQVLVVDMPTLQRNRDMLPTAFWNNYKTQLKEVCARQKADYLFLSDSTDFIQRDFIDNVHVSFRGGAKVLAKIADEIVRNPQLASALNSNNNEQMISSKKSSPPN